MAIGKKTNEELKASKLFDVSGFTAVVTGGGTGIGLSESNRIVASRRGIASNEKHLNQKIFAVKGKC